MPNFLIAVSNSALPLNPNVFLVLVVASTIPAASPLIKNLPSGSLLSIVPLPSVLLPSTLFNVNVSPALKLPVISLTRIAVCPAPFNPVLPFNTYNPLFAKYVKV